MSSTTVVTITEVVVPQIFTPYTQQITQEKARIIQAGVAVRDNTLDELLGGGGLTFNVPSWQDLLADDTNHAENVSTDNPSTIATSMNTTAGAEVAVRLSRNAVWSTMDLAQDLSGSDPAGSIASRVGYYWTRRMQKGFVATMNGIFAEDAAGTVSGEHVQNDLVHDVSGSSYTAGVTDFSAAAFLDTLVTMGDSMDELGMVMVHSIVYNRMQKNNLIDFIPDSEGVVNIPVFQGKRVVIDDGMPNSSGVFDTWLFGQGAVRLGVGTPKVPTETLRIPGAGNGSGQENLYNRVEWVIHPVGHAYIGTAPNGGPSNASTSNNLAAAGSWKRIFPERKQIKIARLVTREF